LFILHGERNAMGASCPNIAVETDAFRDSVLAYLMIDLADSSSIMQEKIYLFPDEIQSIRLEQVSDDKFTPVARQ